MHKLVKTSLPITFWVFSLTFSYLTWCFRIAMKGKRLKRYKIKTTYSEPNFAYQAKIILLLLFVFQFNTIIQSHNEHEMLFHFQYKTFPFGLTRVGLRDYFYAEMCLRPNHFKFVTHMLDGQFRDCHKTTLIKLIVKNYLILFYHQFSKIFIERIIKRIKLLRDTGSLSKFCFIMTKQVQKRNTLR